MSPLRLLTWFAVVVACFSLACVALVVLTATVRAIRDDSKDSIIEVEHQ